MRRQEASHRPIAAPLQNKGHHRAAAKPGDAQTRNIIPNETPVQGMPAGATARKGRAGRLSAPLRGVPAAAGAEGLSEGSEVEGLMHITTSSSDWSDDKIAKLRRLWDEGLPAAEIGRRLGTTKNAVIGKAWRLELPPRRVSDSPNPVPSLAEIMTPD